MKRKTNKTLGLLLAALMLANLLSVSALAATKYYVWVGGVQVTDANAADILGDGTASYNAKTKTLTLDNFSHTARIYATDDLTISLVGDNTITGSSENPAILLYGSLTVTGSGTLTAKAGSSSKAIQARTRLGDDGNITIRDTTVTVANGSIGASGGVDITRSKLTVSSDASGISSGDKLTVTDSDIIINAAGIGIICEKELTVKGSDVDITVVPDDNSYVSYGIQCRGITISNSDLNLEVQSDKNTQLTRGISDTGRNDLLIEKGSNVTITCGDAQSYVWGLLIGHIGDTKLTVNGSTLTVKTGDSGNVPRGADNYIYKYGYGICCGGLELVNATVDIDAGKSTSDSGFGVFVFELSVDAKSVLKATQAGDSSSDNIGVFCGRKLNNKGEIYAAAGKPGAHGESVGLVFNNAEGINVEGNLKAQGYTMAVAKYINGLSKNITVTADSINAGASYDGSNAKPVTKTGNKAKLEVTNAYKYVKAENKAPVTSDEPTGTFKDVKQSAWYYAAVQYAVRKGLMNGVGNGKFDPDSTTTGAMVVSILYRLDGEPAVGSANPPPGLAADQWYTKAVIWANEKGIVNRYGDDKFDPDGVIPREQFVTILYRYVEYKGHDMSAGADIDIRSYNDAAKISSSAMPAMRWACGVGLINGDDNKNLLPGNSTTRAQTATIFMRFSKLMR